MADAWRYAFRVKNAPLPAKPVLTVNGAKDKWVVQLEREAARVIQAATRGYAVRTWRDDAKADAPVPSQYAAAVDDFGDFGGFGGAPAPEKHWADVTAVFAAATIVPAKEREQAWRLLETAASAKSMRVRIVALQTRARILEEEEKEEIRQFWNEQQEEAEAEVVKAGAKLLEAMAMTEKAREEWERALKREKDISSRLIDAPRKRKSLFSCFARNRGTGK
jgi:hypothetical protein